MHTALGIRVFSDPPCIKPISEVQRRLLTLLVLADELSCGDTAFPLCRCSTCEMVLESLAVAAEDYFTFRGGDADRVGVLGRCVLVSPDIGLM